MLALALVSAALSAPTGPHAVGIRDVNIHDAHYGQGWVEARVYYPALSDGFHTAADTASGPYPLTANMHGWLGQAWMYDDICEELASWGFVVASTDTQTGLFMNTDRFARDTRALLQWVEDRSGQAGHWLEGTVSAAPWSAVGHSMGGATLGELIGIEPRIDATVGFMAYEGDPGYYTNAAAFDGAALHLAGTHDTTAPPAMQLDWFLSHTSARRNLIYEITGAGHQAVTDFRDNEEPMSDANQFDIVAYLASTFLRAEVMGDEDLYAELLGPDTAVIPGQRGSRGRDPVAWATGDGATVDVGLAGWPGALATVYLGTGPGLTGSIELADAQLVAEIPLVDGLADAALAVPAGLVGEVWLQAEVELGGTVARTRAIPLVAGL